MNRKNRIIGWLDCSLIELKIKLLNIVKMWDRLKWKCRVVCIDLLKSGWESKVTWLVVAHSNISSLLRNETVSASPSFTYTNTLHSHSHTSCRPILLKMGAQTTSIGGPLVPTVKSEPADSSAGDPSPSPPHSEMEHDSDKDILCPICMQIIKDAFLTACGHSFCYMCIVTHLQNKSDCPCCSHFLTANHLYPNFLLNKVCFVLFFATFCIINSSSVCFKLTTTRFGAFLAAIFLILVLITNLSSYWEFWLYCSGNVISVSNIDDKLSPCVVSPHCEPQPFPLFWRPKAEVAC